MANARHLEILNSGVSEWNEWRDNNCEVKVDLSGADLRGADLSDADLRGADLRGADLSATRHRPVLSSGSSIRKTDLSRANLSEADLSEADLSRADLFEANLYRANLRRTNLSEALLQLANLSEADLSEADLSEADLSGTILSKTDLSKFNLNGAKLSQANLSEANLSEANLSEADLSEADLSDTNLIRTNLKGANLSGANLSRTNLSMTDLSELNLSGADLSDADLSRASLSGADLSDANLSRANLSGANLSLAFMTDSNWAEVGLDASTNLKNIRFTSEHSSINDGSDSIIIPGHLRYLQWSFIRNIGQLPLFGISWIGLATSLLVLNNLGWWNSSYAGQILLLASGRWPIPDHLSLEIPIPGRLVLTVLDALLLVVGSTLYKFACPQRIQTFTEVEWVEEHRNPRLLYLAESFKHRTLRITTLIFLLAGGLLALYLLGASIVSATKYAWPVMAQWLLR